jgi:hypothetical protein
MADSNPSCSPSSGYAKDGSDVESEINDMCKGATSIDFFEVLRVVVDGP